MNRLGVSVTSFFRACLHVALFSWVSARSQADCPRQPSRMVVGFASGGILDVLARAIAAKVSLHIGQQVIVDNKPGAGTTIAGDLVAQAAPDGYTIWFQDITSHAINAWLYNRLPYDLVKTQ